jgi:hypothetical protein
MNIAVANHGELPLFLSTGKPPWQPRFPVHSHCPTTQQTTDKQQHPRSPPIFQTTLSFSNLPRPLGHQSFFDPQLTPLKYSQTRDNGYILLDPRVLASNPQLSPPHVLLGLKR